MSTRRFKLRSLFVAGGILVAASALGLDDGDSHTHHGTVEHPITTSSPESQRLFNLGLSLSYGFNHPEAAHSFRQASAADPECAMCYWGVALVLGPNINAAMDAANLPEIRRALVQAQRLAPTVTAKERAYIQALSLRYDTATAQDSENRSRLDRAYAKGMRRVSRRFPDDLDAATLYAEALMDTTPWNYWNENGEAKRVTEEFLGVLESVLKRDPAHPGANHLLIHTVEEIRPDLGVAAAERLESAPQATGHLIHMASHIYIRVGRYDDAIEVNQRAIAADEAYLGEENHAGGYTVGYVPHNHHMLWAAATFAGRSELALETARRVAELADPGLLREPGYGTLQHFQATPLYALTRFGRWDEILRHPEPDADLLYPRGVWHYARGMAMVRKERYDGASEELGKLRSLAGDESLESVTIWDLNTTASLLAIASEVLAGELAAAQGQYTTAIPHLEQAVGLQDALTYDEPPPWHYPVRQSLGAVLLAAGRPAEAEKVYQQDLDTFPRNGWSLFGLGEALEAQGKDKDAAQARRELARAWQGADLTLVASRL